MALLIAVVIFLLYLFIGFGCGLPGKFFRKQKYLFRVIPSL